MPSLESISAAKELHAEGWRGMTHEQMIASGAAIIDRHFSDYINVKRERDELRQYRKETRAGIAKAIIVLEDTACL